MLYFIYSLLALFTTLIGSLVGIGGGIIMKPVMDLSGHFSAATIGLLSSTTVFAMAVMSFFCQKSIKINAQRSSLYLLGASSVLGGFSGQLAFKIIRQSLNDDALIKFVQNVILLILLLFIFFYMLNQSKIKALNLKHWAFYILTGFFLGTVSSFLGIGGGPFNVALLVFLFSMDIKTATFGSIITILFAQLSNLTSIFISEGISGQWFSSYDLSVLPFMVIFGVAGSFFGSRIKKKIDDKALIMCFNAVQIVIIAVCVFNLIKYGGMI